MTTQTSQTRSKTHEDFVKEFAELMYLMGVYTGSFQAAIRSVYYEALHEYAAWRNGQKSKSTVTAD